MTQCLLLLMLLVAITPLLSSCGEDVTGYCEGRSNLYLGADPIGAWRYQSGSITYRGGRSMELPELTGELKLGRTGTWSQWRSLDGMGLAFPEGGRYVTGDGGLVFYKWHGGLFETAAVSINDEARPKTMTLTINNPAFIARCVLVKLPSDQTQ